MAANNLKRLVLLTHSKEHVNDLSALNDAQAKVLRSSFKDCVTIQSLANADRPSWWYTWLSSRDRFNARLWDRLVWIARLHAHMEKKPADGERPLRLAVSDPYLVPLAQAIATEQGWTLNASVMDRIRWGASRLIGACQTAVNFAKQLLFWLGCIAAAKRYPSTAMANKDADVILITMLGVATLVTEGPYRDIYFGDMHQRLAQRGERVLICGGTQDEPGDIARLAANRGETVPIVTFAHFLTYTMALRSALMTIQNGIRAVAAPLPWGGNARRLISNDIRNAYGDVLLGFMVEAAMSRLLAQHPNARMIHIYENNPWERACDRAAARATPRRANYGYLHCAVLPSHLKNYISSDERDLRPSPDRIICTGPAARNVFLSLGDHEPSVVFAGCALRTGTRIDLAPRQAPPRQIRTVLALLEGLPSMDRLLQFLEQAAGLCPGVKFLVRAHAVLPLEILGPRAGVAIGNGACLHESTSASLKEALAEVDAVIYQGTTASMSAAYLGIPLIKVRLDDTVEDDPLVECPHLKQIVERPEGVLAAIGSIETMSTETFAEEGGEARDYVERYLAQPAPDSLNPFFA